VVPLWVPRFLPFTDQPEHVAAIATLAHWFDPAWRFQEHYTLALGTSQYLLYHLVGALLALVTGSAESGNLVLLTLVGLAFPYATRSLLVALGKDPRVALLACPAFYSRPLVVGFLPYVAAAPFVLFALSIVVKQATSPTRWRAVGLACLAFALFYLHVNAFVLFVLIAACFTWILDPRTPPAGGTRATRAFARLARLALQMAWLVPAAIAAANWALHGELATGKSASLRDQGQVIYRPGAEIVHEFPMWAHDIWRSHTDEWTACAFWALVLWLAFQRGRRERSRDALIAWTPFACTAVFYLALPFQVGAGAMLNVRLALFLTLFVLLVARPQPGRASDLAFGAAVVLGLVVAANAAWQMRQAEREELGNFDAILAQTKPGTRLISLVFQPTSARTQVASWVHMGSYHRARKGGVASFSFSELRHWPIRYRAGAAPPDKPETFWEFNPCVFRNAADGPYYDYVLTRGNIDPFRDAPPGPRWRVATRERDWTLYEKLPGEPNPAWTVADTGPCESRRVLESGPR
jgi:hypothetical protein